MRRLESLGVAALLMLALTQRAHAYSYNWVSVALAGSLANGSFCTTDGTVINCTTAGVNLATQTTGILSVPNGGTGASSASVAMNNLLSTPASGTYSLSCNGTGCTPVAAGMGTVNSGTQYQMAYYASTGTAVSGNSTITTDASNNLIVNSGGVSVGTTTSPLAKVQVEAGNNTATTATMNDSPSNTSAYIPNQFTNTTLTSLGAGNNTYADFNQTTLNLSSAASLYLMGRRERVYIPPTGYTTANVAATYSTVADYSSLGTSGAVLGSVGEAFYYGAATRSSLTAAYGKAAIRNYNSTNQASVVGNIYGGKFYSENDSTQGSVTGALYSVYGKVVNVGTTATSYGAWLEASNSGTIGNGYGLYISGFGSGGTWTNAPYDIYAADVTARNYFGGNVGIGSTSPVNTLDVTGTGIHISDGTPGTTTYNLYNTGGTLYWNGYAIANGSGQWTGATITVPYGGTGVTSLMQHGVLVGNGTSALNVTAAGSTGTVFQGVTGSDPAFSANLTYAGFEANTFGANYQPSAATVAAVNIGTSSSVRVIDMGTPAAMTFYGIANGTDGRIVRLHNASTKTLTLSNESASDAAANRIITGTSLDLSIPKDTSVTMQYDATSSRWRVTGSSNAAKALAAGSDTQVQYNDGGEMAGAAKLVYDKTNGRVGIGSTTPTQVLDVLGDFKITGATSNTSSINMKNGAITYVDYLSFNDFGPNEGIQFGLTSANWRMDVTPLGRTDADGNLNLYGTANNIALWRPALFVYDASNYTTATPLSTGGLTVTTTGTGDINLVPGGNVGIGTTSPVSDLHVAGGGLFSVTGTYGSGDSLPSGLTGAGTRMFFYPQKAAFRAGYASGTQWDNSNIGSYSAAFGIQTTASGYNSFASGFNTTSSGGDSFASNVSTVASGVASVAMGNTTTASGDRSTAMGYNTTASAQADVAIGQYNVGGGTADSWVSTDPIFEIGIGTQAASKANAVTVLKNGNVGIGPSAPSYLLDVEGSSSGKAVVYASNTDTAGVSYGVEGITVSTASNASGVFGYASATSGVTNGVYGYNASTSAGAAGIYGQAAASSGATYGVYGTSASATGYGGYFANTNGGYAAAFIGGNVGIGTTAPAAPLDVSNSATISSNSARFLQPSMDVGASTYIKLGKELSNYNAADIAFNYAGANSSSNSLNFGFYGIGYRMTILGNGNVGIGTTAPAVAFDMEGDARIRSALGVGTIPSYKIDVLTSQYARGLNISNTMATGTAYGAYISKTGAATTNIGLYTEASGATNNYGLIVGTGNVGIGTTSPSKPLTVYNASSGNYVGGIQIDRSDSGKEANLIFSTANAAKWVLQMDNDSTNNIHLYSASGSTYRQSWLENGNVGIGSTSPAATLDVLSSATTGNAVAVTGSSVTTGNAISATANALTTGAVSSLSSTSTAGGASGVSYVQKLARSGANANSSHTAYGLYSTVTDTGTSSTNVAGYFSASGGTNNYGLIVNSGYVGVGTTSPVNTLQIGANSALYHDNNFVIGDALNNSFGIDVGSTGTNFYTTKTFNFMLSGPGTGNVGIGTTSPVSKLHVYGGEVQTASSGNACSSSTMAGAIRYASGALYYCDASDAWQTLQTSSGTWTGATITVPYGGTGVTSLTQHGVLVGNGTSALNVTAAGSTGTVFQGVTGSDPAFSANLTYAGFEANTFGANYQPSAATVAAVNIGTSSSVRVIDMSTPAAMTFYGIANGADGRIIRLHNASTKTLTLANQSSSDAAANRIITGTSSDLSIPKDTSVTMQYDATSSRWRVTGSSNAAKALAAGSDTQVQYNDSGEMAGAAGLVYDKTNVRLGIGTTAPMFALDIQQNLGVSSGEHLLAAIRKEGAAGGGLTLGYRANGSSVTAGSLRPSGSYDLIFGTASYPESVLIQNATGNVGIGTTSPAAALDVNGAIDIKGVNGLSFPPDFTTNGSIAIGSGALANQTTIGTLTMGNVGIGYQALTAQPITTGTESPGNIAIGYQALGSSGLTADAIKNIAVGYSALNANTSGSRNLGVGYKALQSNSTGGYNIALGHYALVSNTTGNNNIAVGINSQGLNNGAGNSSVGNYALYNSASGSGNTAFGYNAMLGNSSAKITGSNNTGIGYQSLQNMETTSATNTALGYRSGYALTLGTNNLLLGANADVPAASTSNFLNLGNVIFATGITGSVSSPAGYVGIGTNAPVSSFQLASGGLFSVTGTSGSGDALPAGLTGAGDRMFYYPKKTAIRAGNVSGTQWDDTNIGDRSVAFGNNTKASAFGSVAMNSETIASGTDSTAMGYSTTAASYADTAIGQYNVGGGTADSWIATDPIFEIGIGTQSASKANAVTVLKNGNVGIGPSAPSYLLDVEGSSSGKAVIYGSNSDTAGVSYGVEGVTVSTATNATGVVGYASAVSGTTNGVYGYNVSTTDAAAGVLGAAYGSSGVVSGVIGYTASTTDYAAAVYGHTGATTGAVRGVKGLTVSTSANASGVLGEADGTVGVTNGVSGYNASTSAGASGVRGEANGASGAIFGVYGYTASSTDYASGVRGESDAVTGVVRGVRGTVLSTTNYAAGVAGSASGASGATYGVYGYNSSVSAGAAGVFGEAHGASGASYGVYGTSASATGYGGFFTNTNGGYAAAFTGGNVGIGTTSPANKLEVYSGIQATHTTGWAQIVAHSDYGSIQMYSAGSGYSSPWTNTKGFYYSGDVNFFEGSSSRLTIKGTTGNVGIGTTGPVARLDVASAGDTSTSYTARFSNSSSATGAGGILFDQGSTYGYKAYTVNTSGANGYLTFDYINESTGTTQYGNALTLRTGYVGIGTTGPVNALDVYSGQGIHIQTGTPTSTSAALYNVGGTLYWNGSAVGSGNGTVNSGTQYQMAYYASTGTAVSGNSAIVTDASNNFLVTGGKVAIGTTATPTTNLTLYNANESTTLTDFTQSLTNAGINIQTDLTDTAYTPGVFWSTADTAKPKAGIWMYETSSASKLMFGTSNAYATGITNTAMTINSSGNVGIGTTGPSVPLDVYGSNSAPAAVIRSSSGQILFYSGFGGANYIESANGSDTSSELLYFTGYSGNTGTFAFNGNVGIGSSSPAASLDVLSSATTGNALSAAANALTTGAVSNLSSSSTAGGASGVSYIQKLARSGANANSSHTAYGLYSTVTDTGTSSTNVAGYFSASGATNNYGLLVAAGSSGFGTTTPTNTVDISSGATTNSSLGVSANYVTTGNGLLITANALTTGAVSNLSSTSTAGGASGVSYIQKLGRSGANANSSHTAYGLYSTVTDTGTSSTNVAGYFSASGGTNNYGLIVGTGNVGIGTTAPGAQLDLSSGGGSGVWTSNGSWVRSVQLPNGGILKWAKGGATNAWGIGQTADQLYFGYSSADDNSGTISYPMVIGSTGNVGIGSSAPAYKLEVSGTVMLRAASGNGLYVNGSGNVGIGTTSPSTLFHVNGAATLGVNATTTGTLLLANGGTSGTSVTVQNNAATTAYNFNLPATAGTAGQVLTSAGGGSSAMTWTTPSSSGTVNSGTQYQMAYYSATGTAVSGNSAIVTDASNNFLVTAGKVAIGTTATPSTSLTVYNPNESTTLTNFTQALTNAGINIQTDLTDAAFTPGVFWSTSDDNATKPKAGIWLYERSASGTSLRFGTSNAYATGITNTALVIDANGNIGIGTTGPMGNLDVAYSGGGELFVRDAAGTTGTLRIVNAGGGSFIESGLSTTSGSAAALNFTDMNSSNIWMTIGSTGKVGIGSSSPAATFDVLSGATTGNAVAVAGSSVTTGNAISATANALTTGAVSSLSSTSTAGGASGVSYVEKLARSGANANSSHTAYGLYSTVADTGTSSTNVAGYFSASGGTNNYGLIVNSGYVGIGTTSPTTALDVNGYIKMSSGTPFEIGGGSGINRLQIYPANPSLRFLNTGDSYANIAAGRLSIGGSTFGSTEAPLNGAIIEGSVGIGTTSPVSSLHVATGGLLSVTGTYGSGDSLPSGLTGAGTRMFFYPQKAAFRAGYVSGTQWDDSSIGNYSVAVGNNTTANGPWSFAAGQLSVASGNYSTAIGYAVTASGNFSSAMGYSTTSSAYDDFVVGQYNVGGGTADSWVATDPIFEIGIGTAGASANAMTVLKNGNVGIGTVTPSYPLTIYTANGTRTGDFHNTGAGGTGVYGSGPEVGVWGYSSGDTGVYGDGAIYGVEGFGTTAGAYGHSSAGIGGLFETTSGYALIATGGNVGIGTTSPIQTLQVNGPVMVGTGSCGATTGGSIQYTGGVLQYCNGTSWTTLTSASSSISGSGTLNYLPIFTGTNTVGNSALYQSSGKIAIGTTTPLAPFHIITNATWADLTTNPIGGQLILETPVGSTSPHRTYIGSFYTGGTGEASVIQSSSYYSSADHGDNLLLNPNGGRVGIGTTSVASATKLQVNGTIMVGTGSCNSTAPGSLQYNSGVMQYCNGTSWTTLSSSSGTLNGSGTANYLAKFTSSDTVGDSVLYESSSNIAIGTTSPNSTLTVYNSNESTTLTDFTQALTKSGINIVTDLTDTAYTPGVFWSTADTTKPKAGIWMYETSSASKLMFGTSNTYATGITNTAMTIDSAGNVGIGTTSPTSNFHVAGTTNSYINITDTDTGHTSSDGMTIGLTASGASPANVGAVSIREAWPLVFMTNASERVRIDASGNVGIGTTSPGTLLDVQGIIRGGSFSVGGDAGHNRIATFGSAPIFRFYDSGDAYASIGVAALSVGTTYAATAAPSNGAIIQGAVGIGSSSPAATLDVLSSATTGNAVAVAGSSVTTGNAISATANALTTGAVSSLSSTSTAGGASGVSYVEKLARSGANANSSHTAYGLYSTVTDTGTSSTNVAGYFSASGGTNNYGLIVNSGYVGIGTTSPQSTVDVAPSGGGTFLLRDSAGVAGTLMVANSSGINYIESGVSRTSGSSADLRFTNSLAANTWMTIASTGNVGIGTTSSLYTLDVAKSGGSTFAVRDSAGTAGTLLFANSGSNNYIESGASTTSGSSSNLYFTDVNAANTWMTISGTGNVGIGTTSPSSRLSVIDTTDSINGAVTVSKSLTDPAANNIGILSNTTVTATSSNSKNVTGISVNNLSDADSFSRTGIYYGLQSYVYHQSTGTLTAATGIKAGARVMANSPSAITSLNGMEISSGINSGYTGTIGTNIDAYLVTPMLGTGGSIATDYGIRVGARAGTTTNYGIYIESPTSAATNYALYSAGGTNFFGGYVGIGTTTPSTQFEIANTGSGAVNSIYTADATDASRPLLLFKRALGTLASPASIGNNTWLGAVLANGYTGSDYYSAAAINFYADGGIVSSRPKGQIRFSTGDTSGALSEVMRLTSAGYVGIGTTGPANALDVYSGQGVHIQAGTPTSTSAALYNVGGTLYWNGSAVGGSGSGTVNSGTQYQMAYYSATGTAVSGNSAIITDASNNLLVTSGKVSIGTTATPTTNLTVYNANESTTLTNFTQSLTNAGINIQTDLTDTAYTPGVFWSTVDTAKPKAGIWMYETSSSGTSLQFGTSNAYATGITNTAMTIGSNGYVGIGTTAPSQRLHVYSYQNTTDSISVVNGYYGGQAASAIWVGNDLGHGGSLAFYSSGYSNANVADRLVYGSNTGMTFLANNGVSTGGSDTIAFQTGGYSNGSTMVITAGNPGSVGIGTTSPVGMLNLSYSNSNNTLGVSNAILVLDNTSASGQSQVLFRTNGTVLGGIRPDYSGNFNWIANGSQGHQFYTSVAAGGGSAPAAVSIATSGVLIGVPVAGNVSTNKLDVIGNANIGYNLGTVAPSNGLIVKGNVGIGSSSPAATFDVLSSATTGNAVAVAGSSVTTGNAISATANALTTGAVSSLSSTSTAGGASGVSYIQKLARSGANANSSHTAYGLYSTVTDTGTSSTNVAGYFSASGGTNNYGLIVNAGYVGIGTTSPANALDVYSGQGIHIQAGTPTSTSAALYNVGGTLYWNGSAISTGASGTVNSGTQYQMAYYSATGTAVSGNSAIITDASNNFLVTGGKVSIGTTATPTTNLTLYNANESTTLTNFTQSLTNAGINIQTDLTDTAYTPGVFWSTADTAKPKAGIWMYETSSASKLMFGTSNTYATGITNTAMTIDSAGYVGIGTTAPTSTLEVFGNTTYAAHFYNNSGSGYGVYGQGGDYGIWGYGGTRGVVGSSTNGIGGFFSSTSGYALITDVGNVGIGTTTPVASLDVFSGATTGNAVAVAGSSVTTGNAISATANALTTGAVESLSSTSTAGGASGVSYVEKLARSGANANASHTAYGLYSTVTNTGTTSTNVAGYLSASGATNNYGLIVANGNVGIGTTSPSTLLHVKGAATLGIDATTTGTLLLANGGTSGKSVTIQNNGATTAYNFNLPTTAGTAGQVLTSAGGGSNAMTWTTISSGSGTVNSGTQYQMAYYSATGTAVSGNSTIITDASNNFLVTGGKVAIGTTATPTTNLAVYNANESTTLTNFTQALTNAGINIQTDLTDTAYTPGVFWSTVDTSKPKAGIWMYETSSSGTSLQFGTSNAYATGITNTAMVINSSGYVGIGTVTPSYPLTIYTANGTRAGDFHNTGAGGTGVYGSGLEVGVWGYSSGDTGVYGDGAIYGVEGLGTTAGVYGHSSAGIGGLFETTSGYALIATGGYVGIGTTAPVNALDVYSGQGIHIQAGTPTNTSAALYNVGGTLYWNGSALGTGGGSMGGSGTANYIPKFSASTTLANSVMYESSSLIGITTTTPRSTLSVYNANESATLTNFTQTITNAGMNIIFDYTSGTYTPGLFWSAGADYETKPRAGIWTYQYGPTGTTLFFGTSNDWSTGITNTAMVIDPSGYVGIGTTGPSYPLHVTSSTAGTAVIYGANTATTGATYGVYGVNASTTANSAAVYGLASGATGATNGVWGIASSSSTNATGVHGSATASTGATMGVYGYNHSSTTDAIAVYALSDATSGTVYGVYASAASASGAGGYFTNSNSSGYALKVSGLVSLAGLGAYASGHYVLCASGTSGTVSLYYGAAATSCTSSSQRFKHGIETIPASDGLDKVRALNPVSFYYNDDVDNKRQYLGFIAEQVNAIDPRPVEFDEEKRPNALNYDQFVPLLTKAVQQMDGVFSVKKPESGAASTVASWYEGTQKPAITVDKYGNIGIGSETPSVSLDLSQKTDGVDLPSGSTAQRPAAAEGRIRYNTDTTSVEAYQNGDWRAFPTYVTKTVDALQTTKSAAYTNLDLGPTATVKTGASAIVTLTGGLSNDTAGGSCFMGFNVSGGLVFSATDSKALIATSAKANGLTQSSATFVVTGLKAGNNTFTAKYKAGSGTCTFRNRTILVQGM